MAVTSTTLTVTIVTRTGDDETLLLEAEIVAIDNDGSTTYYVSNSYYLRLHKSLNISSIVSGSNVGTIVKVGSGLTASVPYEGEDDEYITFTGGDTADLSKTYVSGFIATQQGKIFDSDGNVTTTSLSAPAGGRKTVTASKNIYGVFKVTYTTRYDKWRFSSPIAGSMIIFFIGSDT